MYLLLVYMYMYIVYISLSAAAALLLLLSHYCTDYYCPILPLLLLLLLLLLLVVGTVYAGLVTSRVGQSHLRVVRSCVVHKAQNSALQLYQCRCVKEDRSI